MRSLTIDVILLTIGAVLCLLMAHFTTMDLRILLAGLVVGYFLPRLSPRRR